MPQVPIRDSVGDAFSFVRENWRFVLAAAAAAALAQGAVLLTGPSVVWVVIVLVAIVTAYSAMTAAALGVRGKEENRLVGDTVRVGAAMAVIAMLLIMLFLGMMFIALMVLTAPYQEELKAAGENQAALNEIMNRALTSQPAVMMWMTILTAILVFAFTTRFYLAAPASVDQKRIVAFDSWRMTRGNFLRIAGARLLLLAPAFVFVSALQTLAAYALGAPGGDPVGLMAYSRTNPVGFALFYTISVFLQLVLYSALEAGLASALYSRLKSSG